MTDYDDRDLSAIDVIRCVYLARMTEQRGQIEAARRWQAKVDGWLARQSGTAGRAVMDDPGWGSDQPTTRCPGQVPGGVGGVP